MRRCTKPSTVSHSLPAEGDKPDEERIAKFYAGFGVDAQEFLAAMRSFGVDAKVRRANEYMQRSKVPSTPTVIINGRYLVKAPRTTTCCASQRI